MPNATRREMLAGSGVAAILGMALGKGAEAMVSDQLATDLDRYIRFGVKAAGGPGDTACGAWLEEELKRAGFATVRQDFTAPWFEARRAELRAGTAGAPVVPQAIVTPTGPDGITAPLVSVDPASGDGAATSGAIVLIDLPYARWSSAHDAPIPAAVQRAFATGARAAVLVTNGPTGKAIALNGDGDRPMFDRPVAVLAPEALGRFRGAGEATLVIDGAGGRRPAFNLVGRIDRGNGRWLVTSTPRSGWTIAAGERGAGVAAWLALARWAPAALPDHSLAFLCTSGHEYENLGSAHALAAAAPPADRTAFWLHLGANVAARDWHDLGGGRLLPLPSADPQRFLLTSPNLIPSARDYFAGLPGLEMAYPTGRGAAGELTAILAAGYKRAAGIFGAHRVHHVAEDDARCVDAMLAAPVVEACKRLVKNALS
jgi:hypothetical protein